MGDMNFGRRYELWEAGGRAGRAGRAGGRWAGRRAGGKAGGREGGRAANGRAGWSAGGSGGGGIGPLDLLCVSVSLLALMMISVSFTSAFFVTATIVQGKRCPTALDAHHLEVDPAATPRPHVRSRWTCGEHGYGEELVGAPVVDHLSAPARPGPSCQPPPASS